MKKKITKKEEKTINAEGRTLGRVASEVATILMGKNSPSYERNIFSGFPVKVLNASKIRITPKKLDTITHSRYSGIPGGLRVIKASQTVKEKGFKELIRLATYRMLPGNKLRREMMKNLKIEN